MYANKDGVHFDFDYYMKKHIPWVAGLFGREIEVRRGICVSRRRPSSIRMSSHDPDHVD